MSRASLPYYAALSSLLPQPDESGERPISDIRELRPRGRAPDGTSPAPPERGRVLDDVVARLEGLGAIRHPIEAAAFCLRAAWHVETFRSSLFCVQDVDTGHSVVVYASGPDAERTILLRDAGDAEPSYTASSVQKPFTHRYSDQRPRVRRHRFMPTVGEVLVAPVVSFGRCLATFEILGRGPTRFSQALEDAIGYAAMRYADYLDQLGVVLGFTVGMRDSGYVLLRR